MKHKFSGNTPHDDYPVEERDPLDSTLADFDWKALAEGLGEAKDEGVDYYLLGEALRKVFDWIFKLDLARSSSKHVFASIGKRTLAVAWVVDPERFGKGKNSLRKLAHKLGITAPALSVNTADASRQFGVSNRFQAHDSKKK